MNKVVLIGCVATSVAVLQQLIIYSYSDDSFFGIIKATFALSIPLFIPLIMMVVFCSDIKRDKTLLLARVSVSAFITTLALYLWWNGLMLIDVWQKQTTGPAQGYGGLILWFGSVKAFLLGACIGLVFHWIKVLSKK